MKGRLVGGGMRVKGHIEFRQNEGRLARGSLAKWVFREQVEYG